MPTVDQPTNEPTNKVTAATALAAVTALISWADDKFWSDQIPGYVEVALITLFVFVGGYFVRNSNKSSPPGPGVPVEDDGLI